MTFHQISKLSEAAHGKCALEQQATNLDDTIWGALIAYGIMGALCGVAMFGLVAV